MAKTKAEKKKKPLNLRQKKLAKAILENRGGSVGSAMREAGYSAAYAKNPQQLAGTKTWNELMDEFLPDADLAAVHQSLLKSKRVERLVVHKKIPDKDIEQMITDANCVLKKIYEFMGEKHVMFWAPNDKARTDALDLAYKLKGVYATKKITIEKGIVDLTDEELDQLLDEEAKKIAK